MLIASLHAPFACSGRSSVCSAVLAHLFLKACAKMRRQIPGCLPSPACTPLHKLPALLASAHVHLALKRCGHREERGVKVRLEIGPKDAEQSQCTIARSQRRAGLVAFKRCGDVDSSLGNQVQAMLKMPDDKVPEGDYSKYEARKQASRIASGCVHSAILRSVGIVHCQAYSCQHTAEMDHGPGSMYRQAVTCFLACRHEAEPSHDQDEDELPEHTPPQHGNAAPAHREQVKHSGELTGDALEDDFGEEVEVGDAAVALSAADKARQLKRRKQKKARSRGA